MVTPLIIAVAIQLIEKKKRSLPIARVLQQIGIGGPEAPGLKTLHVKQGGAQQRVARVALPQHCNGLHGLAYSGRC